MPELFSLYTSDAFLVRCELARVKDSLSLGPDRDTVGVGSYEDEVVLLKRYTGGVSRSEMWEAPESDAVLVCSGPLPKGLSADDNTQPFRFRQWLFGHAGQIDQADRVRERLMAQLPDFLQRAVRGATVSEAIFATFLAGLRELGRVEDPNLEAALGAQLLSKTLHTVEQICSEISTTQRAELNAVATNGRLMLACRRGPAPMYFKPLEGEAWCDRCGLVRNGKDSEPLVREHRRRKSVVVATSPLRSSTWVLLEDKAALAVDRKLSVQVLKG